MSHDPHKPLRDDVRLLGELLGRTLREQGGPELFDAVEQVRALSKSGRTGDGEARASLREVFSSMPVDDGVPVARAFARFLDLANIAEQHHRVRRRRAYRQDPSSAPQRASLEETFGALIGDGISIDRLLELIGSLEIELVLTAHPTEVMRRTMVQKYGRIAEGLARRDLGGFTLHEREDLDDALRREIHAIWETDEIRHDRPTPVDEARWGFAVVEQTLWAVVPRFVRSMDRVLRSLTGRSLPLEIAPIRFGSWMGGDRDGNPNVTPDVTEEVCLLSRWVAADLLHRDVARLRGELSLRDASDELRERVGDAREPYRELLRGLRDRLAATRRHIEARLAGTAPDGAPIVRDVDDVAEDLRLCHRSLQSTGEQFIAEGLLTDVMRRLACFGTHLVRLDLRQEAPRHTEAIAVIAAQLGEQGYAGWDESRKIRFLSHHLREGLPFAPDRLAAGAEVREVVETFEMAARQPKGSLGAYVISMARAASDVLGVELLQRWTGALRPLRVVPLFETVNDLHGAEATLRSLFAQPGYLERVGGRQEVMLGYSDSAKDGGRLAAAWELYTAQERIVAACREAGVSLTLFHGRGGTVGRGGGPIDLAVRSQPPGSVHGKLRITEQGEMIQAKFGLPGIAHRTFELYTTALLRATLLPDTTVPASWRDRMSTLAETSRRAYRGAVEDEEFIAYFRAVTPIEAMDYLNIGSRPARRRPSGGIESLRAIPWIFAWTQMRLMVPSWLGVGQALRQALDSGAGDELRSMYEGWPFFRSTLDLIAMVLAKAAPRIAAWYEERLVPEELRAVGAELRGRFRETVATVLEVTGHDELLEDSPVLRRSIDVRNPYVDPINLVQIELLRRLRQDPEDPRLRDALLVTVNGIAAGMRNTG